MKASDPDLAPVPSGQNLLAWLVLLFEDSGETAPADIYWVLRSGFTILKRGAEFKGPELDNYGSALEHDAAVDKEFARLLEAGYITTWAELREQLGLDPQAEPDVIMPIGILTKADPDGRAKHRVLLDPSRENDDGVSLNDEARKLLEGARTKYANIDLAAAAIFSGTYAWKCDFEDSFMQIALAADSCRFAAVRWRGVLYVYKRGAYGHATLPHTQQNITVALMRAAVRHMRAAGLKCGDPPTYDQTITVNYPQQRRHGHQHTAIMGLLDDVAGFGNTFKSATFGFLTYVWLCNFVGFKLSPKPGKSEPPVNTEMEYLGYLLQLKEEKIALTPARIAAFLVRLTGIEKKGWLTKTELASLIGLIVFLTTVLGMRTYYRSFIRLLITAAGGRRLTLTDEHRRDIGRWKHLCELFNGKTVMRGVRRTKCRYAAYSDASFSGWGWTWLYFVEDGAFPAAWDHRFGRLSREAKARLKLADPFDDPDHERERIWISFCEALAALFCLRRILPFAAGLPDGGGQVITFYEDNQNVCSWLTKLQTSSVASQPVIAEIAWLLAAYNCELNVVYIRSEDNTVADAASRIRTKKITPADYKAAIKQHFDKHAIPQSLAAAGVSKHHPARPELLEVMDVWVPLLAGDATDWHPAPLR